MSNRDLCIMACVFCRDPQFQEWCTTPAEKAAGWDREEVAKQFILRLCGVLSRNELDTNPEAAKRFHELVRKPFLEWKEANT